MSRVDHKISELLEEKSKQEISISAIRRSLTADAEFNDEEVSIICKAISDAELSILNKPKSNPLSFFNGIFFAYFLSLAFIILTILAVYAVIEVHQLQKVAEVPSKIIMWRYFLLAGSLLFLSRNLYRIITHLGRNK